MSGQDGPHDETTFAVDLADGSYAWYKTAAIRSRRAHRASAIAIQTLAAAIPITAVFQPDNSTVPALLGGLIVVVTSLRSTFAWQENYLRFSGAREAVEAERRLYHIKGGAYADAARRDEILVSMISSIEKDEMAGWVTVAANPPRGVSE
jgi:hypothetical protein